MIASWYSCHQGLTILLQFRDCLLVKFMSCKLYTCLLKIFVLYLIDPPMEVKIRTQNSSDVVNLRKDFGEHVLESSADSYTALSCSSVSITWVSPTKGYILSCTPKGKAILKMLTSLQP